MQYLEDETSNTRKNLMLKSLQTQLTVTEDLIPCYSVRKVGSLSAQKLIFGSVPTITLTVDEISTTITGLEFWMIEINDFAKQIEDRFNINVTLDKDLTV